MLLNNRFNRLTQATIFYIKLVSYIKIPRFKYSVKHLSVDLNRFTVITCYDIFAREFKKLTAIQK